MEDWEAKQNGVWSLGSTNPLSPWYDGPTGDQNLREGIPADGDNVNLKSFVVTLNSTPTPASGSLNSLTADSVGQLYCELDGGGVINAETIQGGSIADAFVETLGTSHGTITITGNITAGSAGSGVHVGCPMVIIGDVTGGSAVGAYGIDNSIEDDVTITGNLIYSAYEVPYIGKPPTYTPAASNYIQIGGTKFYEGVGRPEFREGNL
jgi:hypothetical protein